MMGRPVAGSRSALKAVYGRSLLVSCAAAAPIVGLWACKVWLAPRPFWIHYYDPELAYFFQAQRLLVAKVPTHTDHPGTPVQVLGAMIQWIWRIGPLDVQRFLTIGYITGLVAMCFGVWLLVHVVLRESHPWLQVAAVSSFYIAPASQRYLNIWSPELFVLPVGALALVAITVALRQPARWLPVAIAGAAIGMCCAVKVTFVPWLAGAAACLLYAQHTGLAVRAGRLAALLSGACLGFLFFTLPIVSRYPQMFSWFKGVATHAGIYGGGEAALPEASAMVANFAGLVASSKAWHAIVCGGVIQGTILLLRDRRRNPQTRELSTVDIALLRFVIVSAILGYVITLKHYSTHYLLPVELSLVPGVAIVYRQWFRDGGWFLKGIAGSVAAGLLLKALVLDYQSHRVGIAEGLALRTAFERVIGEAGLGLDRPAVVYGWRFPHPAFALRVGDGGAGGLFKPAIDQAFPRQGMYNVWTGEFSLPVGVASWDYLVVSRDEAGRAGTSSAWIAQSDVLLPGVPGYFVLARTENAVRPPSGSSVAR